MFEHSAFLDRPARQGWSFAGSLILQVVGVAILLLVPILNTYEIDLSQWASTTFRLAVPPPPAPPPPRVQPAPRPARVRYEADFQTPSVIPDKVALLHDLGEPAWPMAGVPAAQGPQGGMGVPGSAGVIGMVPAISGNLPLPPPIRVGGRIQNARITQRVQPVYPLEAIEQQVSGVVKLEAIIAVDGAVRDVKLIEGHPMLAAAAIDAVSQWRYRPTKLNGVDMEVVTLIDVRFNLTVVDEKERKRRIRAARRQRNSSR